MCQVLSEVLVTQQYTKLAQTPALGDYVTVYQQPGWEEPYNIDMPKPNGTHNMIIWDQLSSGPGISQLVLTTCGPSSATCFLYFGNHQQYLRVWTQGIIEHSCVISTSNPRLSFLISPRQLSWTLFCHTAPSAFLPTQRVDT